MIKEHTSSRIGVFCAFLAAVLFGTISTIAKPTLASVNPILLSSLVYVIAAITMTGVGGITLPKLDKKYYFLIVGSGISGGVVAPILYFSGLAQTSSSDTSVISNSEILFTIILAILFFREKLNRRGYLSMMLVLGGIFVITTNLQISRSLEYNVGNILILASSVFWGIDNNISRILTKKFKNSAKIAQLKSAIGGIILFCVVVLLQIPLSVDASQIPNIVVLGAGGFAGSLYFFLTALRRIGTVRTTLIFSLFSPIGLVTSSLFLYEQITVYQIIATLVMLVGIYLMMRPLGKY